MASIPNNVDSTQQTNSQGLPVIDGLSVVVGGSLPNINIVIDSRIFSLSAPDYIPVSILINPAMNLQGIPEICSDSIQQAISTHYPSGLFPQTNFQGPSVSPTEGGSTRVFRPNINIVINSRVVPPPLIHFIRIHILIHPAVNHTVIPGIILGSLQDVFSARYPSSFSPQQQCSCENCTRNLRRRFLFQLIQAQMRQQDQQNNFYCLQGDEESDHDEYEDDEDDNYDDNDDNDKDEFCSHYREQHGGEQSSH